MTNEINKNPNPKEFAEEEIKSAKSGDCIIPIEKMPKDSLKVAKALMKAANDSGKPIVGNLV